MGANVCKKCGMRQDSPYIVNNATRTHCRLHHKCFLDKETLICVDCGSKNKKQNCRHTFVFRFCCFLSN